MKFKIIFHWFVFLGEYPWKRKIEILKMSKTKNFFWELKFFFIKQNMFWILPLFGWINQKMNIFFFGLFTLLLMLWMNRIKIEPKNLDLLINWIKWHLIFDYDQKIFLLESKHSKKRSRVSPVKYNILLILFLIIKSSSSSILVYFNCFISHYLSYTFWFLFISRSYIFKIK